MMRLLLLPITLPLRIVRATAEVSLGVARGVLDAVRPTDDDLFVESQAPPRRPPAPAPEPELDVVEGKDHVETEEELEVVEGKDHVETEEELVAEAGPEREPGPEIHVDEPWPGYDAMELDEVLAQLEDADEAQVAIVRLYERQHENRQAVLLATGEEP
jgi:hypothetical protein